MRPLSRLQSVVFVVGAVLMVAGAVAALFRQPFAPWLFAPGAVAYVAMQLQQRYEGRSFTIKRLRGIMVVSDVLLLLTALLMMAGEGNPLGLEWTAYLSYVRNNWVVLLLIAAVLQLYTVSRISFELEKETNMK